MATNKGQKGGLVKGRSHATGGVKSVIVDTNKPIELEGGEAVINKTTVRSSKLYSFQNQKLTAKEILSKLNIDGGGVPIGSEGEGSFEKGGIVEAEVLAEYPELQKIQIEEKQSKMENTNISISEIEAAYNKKQVKSTKEQVLDVLKRATLESSHISILENWEGEGSVKEGDYKTGILHEFFTPYWLCKLIGEIVKNLGITNPKVLDPAIGTSRLVDNIKYRKYVGFEVNPFNFEISKKLHYGSNVNLYNQAFETAFLKYPRYNSLDKKSWLGNDFDLVVSNPPYGEYAGEYKSFMPKIFSKFETLFIYMSMSLVKSSGYGIFILPQSFMNNGNMYNKQKEEIMKICRFIDAVRLPNKIFKSTDIGVDLLILQKI